MVRLGGQDERVSIVDLRRLDLWFRAVSEVAEPFETAIGMVAKGFGSIR
jgi:hypothetical protein